MGEINSEKVLNMMNCVEIYQLKPFCIHRFFFVFGPQSNYRVAYIILKYSWFPLGDARTAKPKWIICWNTLSPFQTKLQNQSSTCNNHASVFESGYEGKQQLTVKVPSFTDFVDSLW